MPEARCCPFQDQFCGVARASKCRLWREDPPLPGMCVFELILEQLYELNSVPLEKRFTLAAEKE